MRSGGNEYRRQRLRRGHGGRHVRIVRDEAARVRDGRRADDQVPAVRLEASRTVAGGGACRAFFARHSCSGSGGSASAQAAATAASLTAAGARGRAAKGGRAAGCFVSARAFRVSSRASRGAFRAFCGAYRASRVSYVAACPRGCGTDGRRIETDDAGRGVPVLVRARCARLAPADNDAARAGRIARGRWRT